MIAAEITSMDVFMLVAVFLLLFLLTFLSVAEMGLSRVSRHKAMTLADKGS